VDRLGTLLLNNSTTPEARLATVAALCDHDAEIDGEPLPTDNPRECIEALAESSIANCLAAARVRTIHEHFTQREGTSTQSFEPRGRETKPITLTFTLARREHSRHPNCWLITAISQAPAPNTS